MVSALEASANLHLKPILENLKDTQLYGIFDKSFGKPLYPSSDFGIMGFIDALGKIRLAKQAIKKMAQMSFYVDTVLLMDSPAFNIPLAKAIKKINPNARIIYYILPQVWAWKAKRVPIIEANCDYLASILPFEQKFYTKSTYVGHPLLDELHTKKDASKTYNTIAFLPGSRKSEIKKLMPIFREVKKSLQTSCLLVVPSFFKGQNLEEIYGDISGFALSYSTEESLSQSDFAFICSGTATLEAALIGTPFVLAYKAKWLDYFIAKNFVKLSYVGLANIILTLSGKEALHRELLQEEVSAQNLLQAYKNHKKEKFAQKSKELQGLLKHGAARNVANIIKNSPII